MNRYQTTFIKNSVVDIKNTNGKLHVCVVGGGMSAEREVSLVSSNAVTAALIDNGYRVTFVDMGADIANTLSDINPDVVYNCLHGTYGEDGCLPGLLNIMQIPYTHSGVVVSSICFNKARSKELFLSNNIQIAKSIIVEKSERIQSDPLPRPYVIKPLAQGSSIGIEIILAEDEFCFADYDFPYGNQVIIEQYIKGRELQVAVLNGKAFGVLEIKLLKRRFYDYDTKYTAGFAQHILPATLPDKIHNEALKTSEKLLNIIGTKGLIRAEFIYSEELEKCYLLELNTHPGMTPLSICPEILAHHGINFNQLVDILIDTASFER